MARVSLPSLSHVLLTLAAIATVSVAGWIIFAGLSTQRLYQIEAAKAAGQAADRARAQMKRDCRPLSSADQNKCISDISNTYRSYRKETRDLEAQRTTALWTALMGAAALIGMAVSVIGVGLVYLTFQASRRSADAANATLEHERKRSAAELRPWIVIEPRITALTIDDKGLDLSFELSFRNIGKTAATNLWVKFTSIVRGDDANKEIDRLFAEWTGASEPKQPATLMPGEEFVALGAHMSNRRFIKWIENADETPKVMWVIVATVSYWSDLDQAWHRTDRSFAIGPKDTGKLVGHWFISADMRGEWDRTTAQETFVVTQLKTGETT